ncbi:MAG: YlxR family protein [Actinomycetota bacterium]|nr:YlxR family protein [Actinomycetota bacterium]
MVGADGRMVLDRKGAGRGAWLCQLGDTGLARPECVAMAKKRGAFARALRVKVPPADIEALLEATARPSREERD